MAGNWIIEGGRVLSEGRLAPAALHIEGGTVVGIDRTANGNGGSGKKGRIDATGLLVLPGLIDVHGDAFERQIMPRPQVMFDMGLALRESDRQLVANGVTTAFHAITISWEPGLRSLENASAIIDAWLNARASLQCDTRVHLRWEAFAFEAVDQIEAWLDLDPAPILAFNDHTTSTVRKAANASQNERRAARTGLPVDTYLERLQSVWAMRDAVPKNRRRLAEAARDKGVVALAHDEASPQDRSLYRDLGVVSSEFPLTFETAEAAREAGEHTILGAPNVVLGGSQTGAICATEAIGKGLCTVLASDYYYPALLHAPFKLCDPGDPEFGRYWNLVSQNPAEAAGLDDRGTLAPGKRADVLLVDASDRRHPRVEAAIGNGELIFSRRSL